MVFLSGTVRFGRIGKRQGPERIAGKKGETRGEIPSDVTILGAAGSAWLSRQPQANNATRSCLKFRKNIFEPNLESNSMGTRNPMGKIKFKLIACHSGVRVEKSRPNFHRPKRKRLQITDRKRSTSQKLAILEFVWRNQGQILANGEEKDCRSSKKLKYLKSLPFWSSCREIKAKFSQIQKVLNLEKGNKPNQPDRASQVLDLWHFVRREQVSTSMSDPQIVSVQIKTKLTSAPRLSSQDSNF